MLTKEAINRYSLQLCLLGVTAQSGDMQRDASRQEAVNPGHRFRSSNLKPCPSHCLSLLLECAAVRDHDLEPCLLSSRLNRVYNQTADVLMLGSVGQVLGFGWLLLDLVLVKLPCRRVSSCSWKWRMVYVKCNMPQVLNHVFKC